MPDKERACPNLRVTPLAGEQVDRIAIRRLLYWTVSILVSATVIRAESSSKEKR